MVFFLSTLNIDLLLRYIKNILFYLVIGILMYR